MSENRYKRLVLETVLHLGECTTAQVWAILSRHITAASAAVIGQRDRRQRKGQHRTPIVERGKRRLVTDCLGRLSREGKVRRVSVGVYASPAPKLFRAV